MKVPNIKNVKLRNKPDEKPLNEMKNGEAVFRIIDLLASCKGDLSKARDQYVKVVDLGDRFGLVEVNPLFND